VLRHGPSRLLFLPGYYARLLFLLPCRLSRHSGGAKHDLDMQAAAFALA
jgi:hypothetical protein